MADQAAALIPDFDGVGSVMAHGATNASWPQPSRA
jgi:hypothetical protein